MFSAPTIFLLIALTSNATPVEDLVKNETVPLLIADLASADRDDVENAVIHARVLGPLAAGAVPSLKRLTAHPDRVIAFAAESALTSILAPAPATPEGYAPPPKPIDVPGLVLAVKPPTRSFEVGEPVDVAALVRQIGKGSFSIPECGPVAYFEQAPAAAKRVGALLSPANPMRPSGLNMLCSEERSLDEDRQSAVSARLNDSLVLDRPGTFEIVMTALIDEVVAGGKKRPVRARAIFKITFVSPDASRRAALLKGFDDTPPASHSAPNERARRLALLADYRAIPAMVRALDGMVTDAAFYSGFDRFCDRPRLVKEMLSAIDRFKLPSTATSARSLGEELAYAEIFKCGGLPNENTYRHARIAAIRWEVELRRRMKARSSRPGLEEVVH